MLTMKQYALIILTVGMAILMLAVCCGRNPYYPGNALSLDRNSIHMNAGDSWLYKRSFINIGMFAATGAPDTLVGYSYFQATKDTVIDAKQYLIIDGRDYEVGKDTISIYRKRSAVHFSD